MKILGGNQSTLKEMNRLLILKTISNEPMSCSDLAPKIGLSNTGVVTLVEEMVKEGYLIKEKAHYTSIGRRPILISINRYKAYVISISFKKEILINFYSIDNSPILSEKFAFEAPFGLKQVNELIEFVRLIIEKNNLNNYELMNISLSVPGKINRQTGELIYAPYFKDGENLNFIKLFKDAFNVEIFLDNDLKYKIIAEKAHGKYSEKVFNTMYLQNGVEFGCAFVFDGKVHMGNQGLTGEIGIYTVDCNASLDEFSYNQERRYYHQVCSYYHLEKTFREKLKNRGFVEYLGKPVESLNIDDIARGFAMGDHLCEEVVNRTIEITGNIILNLLNLFDFKNIIISSSGLYTDSKYLEHLSRYVNANSRHLPVEFLLASFNEDGDIMGSKYVSLQNAYATIAKR